MKNHSIYRSNVNKKKSGIRIRKTVVLTIALILTISLIPTVLAESGIAVTGVSLDKDSASIAKGSSLTLTAFVSPENAANRNVVWSSSDTGISSVENGKVTGVSSGTAVVTVTTENSGFSDTCEITVYQKTITASAEPVSIELCPGDTMELDSGSGTWSSSSSAAAVDGNVLTAKKTGEADIKVTAGGVSSVVYKISVVSPLLSSSYYTIDREKGIITGITKFTSSSKFFSRFSNNANDLKLETIGGDAYSGTAVGTGMALSLTVNGKVRDTLLLVLPGDEDGDGAISIADYTLVRLQILGKNDLKGHFLKACDIDGDGKVTVADYTLIRLDILGVKSLKGDTPDLPEVTDKRITAYIDVGLAQRGKPYVWGAEGPDSFDCSGFVYYCLNQSGYKIGRTTADSYSKNEDWQYVKKDELKPGDIMFFKSDSKPGVIGHTGIYLGDGYFIHASSSYKCVIICTVTGWYSKMLSFGRRVYTD